MLMINLVISRQLFTFGYLTHLVAHLGAFKVF